MKLWPRFAVSWDYTFRHLQTHGGLKAGCIITRNPFRARKLWDKHVDRLRTYYVAHGAVVRHITWLRWTWVDTKTR